MRAAIVSPENVGFLKLSSKFSLRDSRICLRDACVFFSCHSQAIQAPDAAATGGGGAAGGAHEMSTRRGRREDGLDDSDDDGDDS